MKKKKSPLLAYFGTYLDAIQGDPSAIQGLDPTKPTYTSPFRDNPPGAVAKPYGDPFVQSNTLATSAQEDSMMMKKRDFTNLPTDEQQFVKPKEKKLPINSSQINIKSLVGSIFPFINALMTERDPVRTKPFDPLEVYNPHPLGTGSQAIYEDGGTLKAKSGIHIKPSKRGTLHTALGVKQGDKIPSSKLSIKEGDSPALRKKKQFAINAKKWHHEWGGELASGGSLSPAKAREMLHDGTAHGKKLTDKQRKYFGWKASQADMGTMLDPVLGKGKTTTIPDETRQQYSMFENVNHVLALGGNPFSSKQGRALGRDKSSQALIDDLIIYNNRADSKALTPQQRMSNYYSMQSSNPEVKKLKDRFRQFGTGPVASYNDGPDIEKINLSHNPTMKDGGKMNKAFWGAIASAVGGQAAGQGGQSIMSGIKETAKNSAQAPQELMNFIAQMASFKDQFNQGGGYAPGPYLQPEQSRYLASGGQVNQLQINDKGSAELISDNPYDGGTIQLNGPSHADNGIDMSYGNSRVEGEGGETAIKDNQGNLHIMGNMKVPGSNTKFKTLSKKIAEQEKKYDYIKMKGTTLVNSIDPQNKYDKLKFNSGRVMMQGGDLGQKDLASKKNELTSLQNALLDTAQEFNLDPEALSKGETKKAKAGTFQKAASGKKLGDPVYENDPIKGIMEAIGRAESGNNYNARAKKGSSAYGKYQMIDSLRQDLYNKYFKDQYKNFNAFDTAFKSTPQVQEDAMNYRAQELNKKYNGDLTQIVLAHRLGEGGANKMKRNPSLLNNPIFTSIEGSTDKETPNQYLKKVLPSTKFPSLAVNPTPTVTPINPTTLPKYPLTYKEPVTPTPETVTPPNYGQLTPPTDRNIPSNVKGLGLSQILPELYAMGSNQLEPVAAQQYTPLLEQPYQVSFQDRLNENQATFNAIQRQLSNNPLALSSLSAQQYQADSGVLADEFRFNQGEANRVYNQNRATINDAELKNLAIKDQQYTRQAQAKSNTKAQTQAILNSISGKYLQNRADNQRLALYENLYNFRAQDTNKDGLVDKMINYNPDPIFNYGDQPQNQTPLYQRVRETTDANNNLKQRIKTTPSPQEQKLIDLKIQKEQDKKSLFPLLKRFKNTF